MKEEQIWINRKGLIRSFVGKIFYMRKGKEFKFIDLQVSNLGRRNELNLF